MLPLLYEAKKIKVFDFGPLVSKFIKRFSTICLTKITVTSQILQKDVM